MKDLKPGQICLNGNRQVLASLNDAWNNAGKHEVIWLSEGDFFFHFSGNERGLTLKGNGCDRTFVYIKTTDQKYKWKFKPLDVGLVFRDKVPFYETKVVTQFIKGSEEIGLVFVDDNLRIIYAPGIDSDTKKRLQARLIIFRDF